MGQVEASANVEIVPDSVIEVLRRRISDVDIEIEEIPAINTSPGDTFKVKCENMEEFKELQKALQTEDEETIRKYLEKE